MNTSTKKSTKKHAEFLLYGGKDVHLQPKIVINNMGKGFEEKQI